LAVRTAAPSDFITSAGRHAGRLLVYGALSLLDKGVQCNMEAAMAKVYATEAAIRITSKAIQVHGAFGISTEFPVECLFRAARMLTIPDGTTQINQLVIGRELLGLSAF
jgi:alkylation response protein AidB-like acyl-CoA dehydrogenase